MKRLGRRLFDGITVVSLLMFLTVGAAWLRGYWACNYAEWSGKTWDGMLVLSQGQTVLVIQTGCTFVAGGKNFVFASEPPKPYYLPDAWSWCGFGIDSDELPNGPPDTNVIRSRYLLVPYWFLMLISAAAPGFWLCQRVRRSKIGLKGSCAACGYDLRATPDQCPECGTAPVKRVQI